MTKYNTVGSRTVGQTQMTLRMLDGVNAKTALKQSAAVVSDARLLLNAVEAQLARSKLSSKVAAYLNRYFLVGKSPSQFNVLQIKTTINLIKTGLASDVTLKIGDIAGEYGHVAIKRSGDAPSPSTKSYHNDMLRTADNLVYRRGAIHMSEEDLGDRDGVLTLIHEASHKYAGTRDYCYFESDGLTPETPFTDKQLAIQNADSYGWFVLKAGRSYAENLQTNMYS